MASLRKHKLTEENKVIKEVFEKQGFKVHFEKDQVTLEKGDKIRVLTNQEITNFFKKGIKPLSAKKSKLVYKGIGTPPEPLD